MSQDTVSNLPTQAVLEKLGDLRGIRRLVAEECGEEQIEEFVEGWSITRL